ncbi:MAG: hypothetical protein PHU71_02205 [Candidatus Gracilibacteria bacterium]|nr:hypothetical protein [Candidatus Gracilibacteria bacterium]
MNVLYLIYIVLGLIILLMLLIILKKAFWKKKFSPADLQFFRKKWEQLTLESEKNPKIVVLEADKLLDHALSKLGKSGNLGDKLKKHSSLFSDLNGLWSAHKLRNRIAHELDYEPAAQEGKRALQQFKRALKDLKAL